MSTSMIFRPRVRVVAGTATTLVFLGGIAATGAIVALMVLALAGSVAGSLYAWSKASRRVKARHSLY